MKKKFINYPFGYALIIGFMVLVAYVWNDTWNDVFYDGARCFFLESRMDDIKIATLCVFEEELVWRFIPIAIASVTILFVKPKWLKYIFIIIFTIIVVYIQVVFGAKHHNPISNSPVINTIVMQGGMGLILVITYVSILYYILKIQSWKNKISTKARIKTLIIANTLAYLASCIVHATSNVVIIITQTY